MLSASIYMSLIVVFGNRPCAIHYQPGRHNGLGGINCGTAFVSATNCCLTGFKACSRGKKLMDTLRQKPMTRYIVGPSQEVTTEVLLDGSGVLIKLIFVYAH